MGDFDGLYGNFDADPRVRGTQFEHVCKWFLENDPVYSQELKTVWLWKDWPGRWGGDAGIDLVAEDRNGGLWAIQAKAYDPKYRVSKKDVDKFLSESGRKTFAYRMLIATTDLIDRTGERTIQQQEKRSSFFRLNDLRAAAVDWPASPAKLRPAKRRQPAKPRPHQAEAIRDVLKGFKTSDRGQLIMACGTGKTLAGLFITEKLKAQRTLVLLPSLSLLKQTLNEWRANCANDFAALPVCSDDTVADSDDAAIAHTADLGVPVTTDPNEIATFLRRKSGPLVVLSTYQSSPKLEAAFKLGRVPGFDLVIADEAHRVAGPASSDFATVLDSKAIKGDRRLFMTATPRYFTGRVLKAAQEADYEVASMDDQKKFGPVFHRLPFGDAIERDLLTDYQVVIVGVDDATYREWAEKGALVTRDGKQIDNAATLAGQIGLAKAMRKYDLRRVISFHSRVKRAREFASSMPDVIDWMPARQRPMGTLWSDVATGEMPAGDRYVLLLHLGRLDDADRGLLANARCLSEGVDVPTLDGVAFIDPRRSEVDIVQAVGRAIRKSDAKTVGTIVIPVFIDTDENPDVALDSSVFKPVWDVIKALRAHDAELGEQLDSLRRQIGRKGGRPKLPDKIHLDVPATVGAAFANAFDVRVVEQTSAPWEYFYGVLERYAQTEGHTRVPQSVTSEDVQLGSWVARQRRAAALGTLSGDRKALLEGLPGWSWEARADRWDEAYELLAAFVAETGSARVPQSLRNPNGFRLGSWVQEQRSAYSDGLLDETRRKRLESLEGWSWDAREDNWADGYRHLLNYVEQNGNAEITKEVVLDGYPLGRWVARQRTWRTKGTLSHERQDKLNAVPGWAWDPFEAAWQEGYSHLKEYVADHGTALVPAVHESGGYRLGAWAVQQRLLFGKGKLDEERRKKLEQLPGWVWNTDESRWRECLALLHAYAEMRGSTAVPQRYVERGIRLGNWVTTQRNLYARGTLEPEKQELLESVSGWSWDTRSDRWERNYSLLTEFTREHGTAKVPQGYEVDGIKLGTWVNLQRGTYRQGVITDERRKRLESLPGWMWDPNEDAWEAAYSILKRFVRQTGHAHVSSSYEDESGFRLGLWVTNQRRKYRRKVLPMDRRDRLEKLPGWVWTVR
jgi:superfamily II DNA or RNA helicase